MIYTSIMILLSKHNGNIKVKDWSYYTVKQSDFVHFIATLRASKHYIITPSFRPSSSLHVENISSLMGNYNSSRDRNIFWIAELIVSDNISVCREKRGYEGIVISIKSTMICGNCRKYRAIQFCSSAKKSTKMLFIYLEKQLEFVQKRWKVV